MAKTKTQIIGKHMDGLKEEQEERLDEFIRENSGFHGNGRLVKRLFVWYH